MLPELSELFKNFSHIIFLQTVGIYTNAVYCHTVYVTSYCVELCLPVIIKCHNSAQENLSNQGIIVPTRDL